MLSSHEPRRYAAPLAAFVSALLASGCAGPDPVDAPAITTSPAVASPAIYGGSEVEPTAWDAVVALFHGGVVCTGTLVTPRVILTAGHCLADLAPGELPEVFHGPAMVEGQTLPVERFGIHPAICRACDEDVNDFGFVVLESEYLPKGGFPAPIAEQGVWDEAMVEGAPLTLVGYGESDDAPEDPFKGAGVKREVETALRTLSGTGLEYLAGGEGAGTCAGDSGGPAFAPAEGGGYRLAGVLARGECGEASFYGVPYSALCWLRDEAGADVVPAGCGDCDCLDTAPAGCACGVPARPVEGSVVYALASLIALMMIRKRRRRAPVRLYRWELGHKAQIAAMAD